MDCTLDFQIDNQPAVLASSHRNPQLLGIKAIRLIAAGYGDWTPKQLADYQSENPMYSPLKLTWNEKQTYTNEASGNTFELPTVLGWNATPEMKANNRRLQITFLATTADNLATQQRSGDG